MNHQTPFDLPASSHMSSDAHQIHNHHRRRDPNNHQVSRAQIVAIVFVLVCILMFIVLEHLENAQSYVQHTKPKRSEQELIDDLFQEDELDHLVNQIRKQRKQQRRHHRHKRYFNSP